MVYYDEDIKKEIDKGKLPKEIAKLFVHAFVSIDTTKDLNLFDIKKLVSDSSVNYYRLRKGKYRAVFKIEDEDMYVLTIAKRAEVYKKWQ
jgi:mRNA interferase RelE/StbE